VERRRDERFETDLNFELDQAGGNLRNVSAGGVFFLTELDLQPGQRITFRLRFAGTQNATIVARCVARVTRVEQREGVKGVGAELAEMEFRRKA
jgi:hypothetical protein